MHRKTLVTTFFIAGFLATSAAHAACSGGLGRGWASGKGDGKFEMAASDRSCLIAYPAFMDSSGSIRTPATQTALTRAPKSGAITLAPDGLVYTPAAGFKGADKFCIRNTTPAQVGKLSGCVTVTVR